MHASDIHAYKTAIITQCQIIQSFATSAKLVCLASMALDPHANVDGSLPA